MGGALTEQDVTVLDLVPAAGAAIRLDGQLRLLGDTPPAQRVPELVAALLAAGATATDAAARVVPAAKDLSDTASGVLAVPLSGGDFLAWFRPETLREVTWGGNPYASKVAQTDDGPRLSPRRSFAAWSETVRGTSAPWREHEVAAARALAALLTAAALNRSEEDNRLVGALQRTLLLQELPRVPGVALAARYRPSAEDVVGGDWYDLVPLPGGTLAVVVGDVAGHGLAAASVTAQLRHALRAQLLRAAGPAAALELLNEMTSALLPGELATVVVAELDPGTGDVVVASAGHLPVLHAHDGTAEYVMGGRGPALGVLDRPTYAEARLTLAGDDRLLLFSDGLVERGRGGLQRGLDALREAVAAGPAGAEPLLDAVLASLAPPDADDVTVLALART
ncbi:SpoIIE family protein phosphatase [Blastococcus sp. TF02-9]|uniref:PP2C family protein-serine/threonine phosphatase n=1 Tax=Blastococcus sp. TF02-09 TaxID=2250576 RepID=UPI002100DB79|nr:SpoIIE family protein phosphatase [Blastococcus sp. TF02-9]